MTHLLTDCGCADAFEMHDAVDASQAECTMLYIKHLGVMPKTTRHQVMILRVADKVGWHQIMADVNKVRMA